MEITLNQLLNGNATIIKNKEYLSTPEYVQPFVDKMAKYTDDFRVTVKLADQLSITDEKNLIFNRVLVQAVLPEEHCIDRHDEVVGFLYGLDVRKPVAKIYRGYLNQACTNLTVFNPQWIEYQEMEEKKSLTYKTNELMEGAEEFKRIIEGMKSTFLPRESKEDELGKWVDFSLRQSHNNGVNSTKLSASMIIDAYKDVYMDNKSDYYVGENEESSLFNVYNAFTQLITDDKRDIMNRFEKTLLINQMLSL